MPWQGVTVEEQRENFIRDWKLSLWSVSELAERFCISRKTAYKWINRFCDTGKQGYKERSRRPHTSPNATPQYIVNELKTRRGKRGGRGAKKLVDSISRAHPQWPMPSIATANRILDRAGHPRSSAERQCSSQRGDVPFGVSGAGAAPGRGGGHHRHRSDQLAGRSHRHAHCGPRGLPRCPARLDHRTGDPPGALPGTGGAGGVTAAA